MVSVNSRLKTIKIIGQRKVFYRQGKKLIDKDILVTSRNGDREIIRKISMYQKNE